MVASLACQCQFIALLYFPFLPPPRMSSLLKHEIAENWGDDLCMLAVVAGYQISFVIEHEAKRKKIAILFLCSHRASLTLLAILLLFAAATPLVPPYIVFFF